MPDDLAARISEVASGPAEVEGDAGKVVQPNIRDLIEADKYLAEKSAATTTGLGLRFRKLVPPGAA